MQHSPRLCAALAAIFVAVASGCVVEPLDPVGHECQSDSLCPSPYTCVFPPAPVTEQAAGEDEDAGPLTPPERAGMCALLPCARVVCPDNEQCVNDACFPKDCTAESCGVEEVCSDGKCVARSCVGVECDPNSGCAQSECHPRACEDRTCGEGELCIQQSCVDARCAGVICPGSATCVRGFCYSPACNGVSCPEEQLCTGSSCVDRACIGVVCPGGLRCVKGTCQLCAEGLREVNGTCVSPAPNGDVCQTGQTCDGGNCVDGRCCAAASCGACKRCDVAGKAGTCSPVDAGTLDPLCGGYRCSGTGACATSCAVDGDCRSDHYCSASTCVPKKTQGTACSLSNQCGTGHCVAGVCCDTACTGSCQSCVLSASMGTCKSFAAGTATSTCAPYQCAADGGCAASCVTDAGCSAGACIANVCNAKKGDGNSCAGASECLSNNCVDGVCCNSACGNACEQCNLPGKLGLCSPLGAGAAGTPSCSPRVCNGTAGTCPASCTADTGCVNGYYCSGGACVAKQFLGGGCAASNQCNSGICVAGVCCNTTCTAACDSCARSGFAGTCGPRTAESACTAGGQTGVCTGSSCTITHTAAADLDSWVSSIMGVSSNWGNGQGTRLVVGETTYVTPAGDGLNRSLIRFPLTTLFQGVPNTASITHVELKLRVRGKNATSTPCWSIGGAVKFFVEELSGPFEENGLSDDCGATTNGTAASRWPGPNPITTNRAGYEGAPVADEWISVDVTLLVKAAHASSKNALNVRLVASNGSTTYEENNQARKVSFYSRHTASAPYLELTYAP